MSAERPVVLVADDAGDILMLASLVLERAGYEVLQASDGEQALALARAHTPDVIVLDVMMPKLTGHDVVRELRADEATTRVPIILLTARVQDADIALGFEAGADAYVTKPFRPRELQAEVRALLERS